MENLNIEAYPPKIQAALEKSNRLRGVGIPSHINGIAPQLVFEDLKLWRVGSVSVSFKGGDSLLHKKIVEIADQWTLYGNIEFDWGYSPETDSYRLWSPNDNNHIRVGFEYNGYWSLVGTDSVDQSIVSNGEITLNLSQFDKELPQNWEGTVLHEFGHALGYHHEHQSPSIECDFDWPRLYDYLGGHPNYWPKSQVDHNLKQLRLGGMTYSAHDSKSIMHYSFPEWMFLSKSNSPCCTEENTMLSLEDKEMMGKAYPNKETLISILDETRIKNLESLVNSSNVLKNQHEKHLNYYKMVSNS